MTTEIAAAPDNETAWIISMKALMDRGLPVRAGQCAREIGVSNQKAHRILSNMVQLGSAIRLTRGLYAPAGYVINCDDPEIERACTSVRRRVIDFLGSPSSRKELMGHLPGEVTKLVLERLCAEGVVVTTRAPEGELLQLTTGQPKGEARKFANFVERVGKGIPEYPRIIRLSRLTEHLAAEGRTSIDASGVFSVRARARTVLDRMVSAGTIEILSGLRRDILIRRSKGRDGGNEAQSSESVEDALGNCLVVLSVLNQAPAPLGVVALRDLTGLEIACNSGIICRMERAGLIGSQRTEGEVGRLTQVRYHLTAEGRTALDWHSICLADLSTTTAKTVLA